MEARKLNKARGGWRRPGALLVLIAIVLAAGCSEPAGESIVLKRREPRTLLTEGSALTAEEAARREKRQQESVQQARADRELLKSVSRLERVKKVDTILTALQSIGELGPRAARYLDKILPFLGHEDPDVRATALSACVAVDAQATVREHRAALSDRDADVRRQAVALWGKHRPDDPKSLLPLLEDMDGRVQYDTIQALAIGRPGAEVLSGIAGSVEDLDGSSAKAALRLILPRRTEVAAFDEMIEMLLDHQDETARLRCADDLSAAGILNQRLAAKAVQCVLEDPAESVRAACCKWLKAHSPVPPPAFDPTAGDAERESSREGLLAWLEGLKGLWKN